MTYSKWYDVIGIISCMWLMLCVNDHNALGMLFIVLLITCAGIFIAHILVCGCDD